MENIQQNYFNQFKYCIYKDFSTKNLFLTDASYTQSFTSATYLHYVQVALWAPSPIVADLAALNASCNMGWYSLSLLHVPSVQILSRRHSEARWGDLIQLKHSLWSLTNKTNILFYKLYQIYQTLIKVGRGVSTPPPPWVIDFTFF